MRVLLSSRAQRTLSFFVRKYQNFLIRNLFDTGIQGEEAMREQYLLGGENLANALLDHINEYMSRDVVGYELMQNGHKLTVTKCEGRLIFLEYIDDNSERKILYLKIFKK